MKHVISEIVELSIRRNGGNLNEFIPSLSGTKTMLPDCTRSSTTLTAYRSCRQIYKPAHTAGKKTSFWKNTRTSPSASATTKTSTPRLSSNHSRPNTQLTKSSGT